MRATVSWSVMAVLALGLAVGTIAQYRANAALRTEVDLRRRHVHRLAAVRGEEARRREQVNAASAAVPMRAVPVPAAILRLRSQVAELQARWQKLEVLVPSDKPADPGHFPVGVRVPASAWIDAGIATPAAAFETALWSAAGGDVGRLAQVLVFADDETRSAAQSLYDTLPAADRQRYGSPERLIAALTVPKVPTAAVEVKEWGGVQGRSVTLVTAKMVGADGGERSVLIPFQAEPGGWRLLVTRATIARFAAQLQRGG